MGIIYAKEFFDLQVLFAKRVQVLSALALEQALLKHTNLYVRFGLGRDFNPNSPGWLAYVDGLRGTTDVDAWTYEYYMRDAETNTMPTVVATFGCFSYGMSDGGLRLHFRSVHPDDPSPLGHRSIARRRAELANLFQHAASFVPRSCQVIGGSWLYNLEAYLRLFPSSFALSVTNFDRPSFHSMRLWGQMVNGQGQVRQHAALSFIDSLRDATLEQLPACFPMQPRQAAAPLVDFLRFYQLE